MWAGGFKNSIIITPKTSKCSKNENTALLYDKHKSVPVSNVYNQNQKFLHLATNEFQLQSVRDEQKSRLNVRVRIYSNHGNMPIQKVRGAKIKNSTNVFFCLIFSQVEPQYRMRSIIPHSTIIKLKITNNIDKNCLFAKY